MIYLNFHSSTFFSSIVPVLEADFSSICAALALILTGTSIEGSVGPSHAYFLRVPRMECSVLPIPTVAGH